MSITSAAARLLPEQSPPRRAPAGNPDRRLRPVTGPATRRRPKLVYALVALGGAAAITVAQIGLSLAITHDSFVLSDLNSQQHELDLQAQALEEELAGLGSPQLLAAKADALGMVVAGSASYLRLSDGAVLGANLPAGWASTVDPNGAAAVSNALIDDAGATGPAGGDAAADGTDGTEGTAPAAQNLPPAITDGLPSPTTR